MPFRSRLTGGPNGPSPVRDNFQVTRHPVEIWKQSGHFPIKVGDSKDQARLAVNIIRVINTAEVGDCRTKNGKIDESAKFLSWEDLRNSPCLKPAQSRFSGSAFSHANELSFSQGPERVPALNSGSWCPPTEAITTSGSVKSEKSNADSPFTATNVA